MTASIPQMQLDAAIVRLSQPGGHGGLVEALRGLQGALAEHPRTLAALSIALHREGDVPAALDHFDRVQSSADHDDPVVKALLKRARKSLYPNQCLVNVY